MCYCNVDSNEFWKRGNKVERCHVLESCSSHWEILVPTVMRLGIVKGRRCVPERREWRVRGAVQRKGCSTP